MDEELFRISGVILCGGPLDSKHVRRHRITGTDSVEYFHRLLELEGDWLINIDEDAFLLNSDGLQEVIETMERGGYAACGLPDGGVVPIRRHNPAALNACFNVFDIRRVRPIWKDWERVVSARHRPEYEQDVPQFTRRGEFQFDQFEPYYCVSFVLRAAGERILCLDAEEWNDGVSTVLKTPSGEPLLIHAWYTRLWQSDPHTPIFDSRVL